MYSDPEGTDAIYVVTTSDEEGLWGVGHAILYFQCNGKWYRTEFTGNTKSDAQIYCYEVDKFDLDALHSKYGAINCIYMYGDYSKCLDYATRYANRYNRKYNLLFNNCSEYVFDALDYCEYGFRRIIWNRWQHMVPNMSRPLLKAVNSVIRDDYRTFKNACGNGGGGSATFAYYVKDDNGFHMLDRYRLW